MFQPARVNIMTLYDTSSGLYNFSPCSKLNQCQLKPMLLSMKKCHHSSIDDIHSYPAKQCKTMCSQGHPFSCYQTALIKKKIYFTFSFLETVSFCLSLSTVSYASVIFRSAHLHLTSSAADRENDMQLREARHPALSLAHLQHQTISF